MQNLQPVVSIVTPSFNQGRFVEQTILSVLNQTYSRIEYLVIDGASTDQSVDILKKYEEKIAYWHSRRDNGFADAISQGFQRSTGDILAYLNSDDLLAPDAVERAVQVLQSHKDAVMVYGNRVCIDEEGQLLYFRPNMPWLSRTPYISMTIGQESCFWRREAYQAVGGMNTDIKFGIDYDLFSKFAQKGAIVHAGDIWGFFRKHRMSKTMTQYQTLGKQEKVRIQNEVWGKEVNRIKWISVYFFLKLYALIAMFFVKKPQWPASLPAPRRTSLLKRYLNSLHETSSIKKFCRRLGAI